MSMAAERPARVRVALAASPGGHVDLLIALRTAVDHFDRIWVLPPSARRDALAAAGERTTPVRIFGSSLLKLAGNLQDVGCSLRQVQPDLVITSGAGVVVPYCLAARALGARVVYMETMARVTTGSRAGRVLSRIADATLVQWPESLGVYPTGRVCSPALLAPGGAGPSSAERSRRAGTFVALGTHWQPFDRLMAMVDEAARNGILPGPITAQVGEFSYPSDRIETISSVSPARLDELIRGSKVVVCHGGAGIIATALRAGRRPLVLARRKADGEHIDDHQHELVDKLVSLRLLTRLGDSITGQDVRTADEDVSGRLPLPGEQMGVVLDELVDALRTRQLARAR
jgi:UDP-N-acetylglucosamine--N-acetylmuramyl-(pentapeptide) pyrophosphoryl-undecaprenol N-acetylglucosamine transferase